LHRLGQDWNCKISPHSVKKDQLFLFAQISITVKIGTAKSHNTV